MSFMACAEMGGLCALQGQALVFNAAAEIGVGFLLLLGLLTPQRSFLLAFVYWRNFLPTRFHTPDAAGFHRQVCAFSCMAIGALHLVPVAVLSAEFQYHGNGAICQ